MAKNTRFVGLDVHAETIAVAVAEGRGKVRALGTIPNRPEAVRRLLGKVGKPGELRVCYEAGPTGYALLAADGDGHRLRGDRAVAGAVEAGGSCQNRSPRRGAAGELVPGRHAHGGLGAGSEAGGAARFGASTRSSKARHEASQASPRKVPAALWAATRQRRQGVDGGLVAVGAQAGAAARRAEHDAAGADPGSRPPEPACGTTGPSIGRWQTHRNTFARSSPPCRRCEVSRRRQHSRWRWSLALPSPPEAESASKAVTRQAAPKGGRDRVGGSRAPSPPLLPHRDFEPAPPSVMHEGNDRCAEPEQSNALRVSSEPPLPSLLCC
jgi:hypothetical protein